MSEPAEPPLSILIAALGGEGGSVLMNWIVAAARSAGHAVQATSVPGVAQRTGSTSYYIEMSRRPIAGANSLIFALMPVPGRVDIVVASELVEAARLMERGFLSPRRTTLVTSTSRTYTTAEKMAMGDGRYDEARVLEAARKLARRVVALDLDAIARANGTMISATLLGALAGAGVLPFARADCERAIGDDAAGAASRRGFAAAFDAASQPTPVVARDVPRAPPKPPVDARVSRFPAALQDIAAYGLQRVTDYQDAVYGQLYLDRLASLIAAAIIQGPETDHALGEAARRLALWMAYEDIPRVADLKTRPERFRQIRAEAEMREEQILHVVEHMKPGVEEIAAMLPAKLGRRLTAWSARGRPVPLAGRPLKIRSTGLVGHTLLRLLAQGRRWRRSSLRFGEEQAAIEHWLGAMRVALGRSPRFAGALAELPRLLKGYADTHARGRANYRKIMTLLVEPAVADGALDAAAPALRRAIAAALGDPEGRALDAALAQTRASQPDPSA